MNAMDTRELIEHFRDKVWDDTLPEKVPYAERKNTDMLKVLRTREENILLIPSAEDRASAREDLRVLVDRVNESILTLTDDVRRLLEECGEKVEGEVLGMPELTPA